MDAKIEEYKTLRTEMLQYLQHYQNIRTFMFTSTTAIFTFLFKDPMAKEPLMYLLPLLVVIPAYLSAVNYWLCVTVDAAYLMVFHEERQSKRHDCTDCSGEHNDCKEHSYRGGGHHDRLEHHQGEGRLGCGRQEEQCVAFHWETRHSQFSQFNEAGGVAHKRGCLRLCSRLYSLLIENVQPLAYILVAAVCFVAYGYFLHQKIISTVTLTNRSVATFVTTVGKMPILLSLCTHLGVLLLDKVICNAGGIANSVSISVDILVGVISFIICFCIFAFVRVKGKDKYVEQWRRVKDEENNRRNLR